MVPEPFRDAAILIVDDERSMVRLLEQLLAHAGYQKLSGTSDPREVVRLCDELEPDDKTLLVLRVDRDLAWGEIARIMLGETAPSETDVSRETVRLRKRFQLLKVELRQRARDAGLVDD